MKSVVKQEWIESERGWGQRPDGYSLHLSKSDLEMFVKEYWDSMPDEIPDCYSRPSGSAYLIDVGDEVYKKIEKSDCGIRMY